MFKWGHVSKLGSINTEFPWLVMPLSDNTFLNNTIKSKIEKTVNMTFETKRVYMNGQMYGSESDFHVDTIDTNGFTFLLFVHDYTQDNADIMGGYFYYKLNGEIRCIEPIKNRAVFFNGNIVHKGCAFNRNVRTLRQSIAWKLYRTDTNIIRQTDSCDNDLIKPTASYEANCDLIKPTASCDNDLIKPAAAYEANGDLIKQTASYEANGDLIKPTASCDNDFIKPAASYYANSDLIKPTASYENDLIHAEVSKLFDSCKNSNGIEQFKPLLYLLNKPYILNCDRSISICFNNSDVNYTISQFLLSLNK
jgi:hypothetical protein